MPQNQKVSALLVVGVAVLGAIYTLVAGNQPLLGLDLQGGVSVVLEPTGTTDGSDGGREVTDEALELTVELLRARIDEIGVAEPEISRQGDNIVVGLPGLVEEQEDALNRLRQTAELRFRPVLFNLGPATLDLDDLEDLVEDGNTEPGTDSVSDGDTDPGTDSVSDGDTDAGDDEESLAVTTGRLSPVILAQGDDGESTDTGTDTNTDTGTDTGTDADSEGTPELDLAELSQDDFVGGLGDSFDVCFSGEVTADEDDGLRDTVILTDDQGFRFCLGPAVIDDIPLTGDMIETAAVSLTTGIGWEVNPTFNSGPSGIDLFNRVAVQCFSANQEICPTSQLAVVLDHQVISAPSINAPSFSRDRIVISGGQQDPFEEEEARRLAEALRFGALPLELVAQETRTVSASIGQDVLRSGVIAGLIGLSLVAIYLLAYYRLAGLVAISGLLLSAILLWTIIAWFGETFGLALSLAGVVGLIVSIGVSTDSNIVYFENVKDSYRAGRRIPTAVERAYESAISTIVKADVVSLIAAVLLYLLTVGAVRGFAFYLGLATILDLIISWMFMRPALGWLARRKAVEGNPRLLGLPNTGGVQ
jgi:preprotein translocase subunit SecD